MRLFMLACAALFAGCLHAQVPAHPVRHTTLAQFEKLLDDAKTIVVAAEVAKTEGWTRREWEPTAIKAYDGYMAAEVYDSAAEIAYRFDLGATRVVYAIRRARRTAFEEFALATESYYTMSGGEALTSKQTHGSRAERFLTQEVVAACSYGPTEPIRRRAVEDVFAAYQFRGAGRAPVYALFDANCPLGVEERKNIVEATVQVGDFPRALNYAEKAFFTAPERKAFVEHFFLNEGCSFGFEAAARLKLTDDDLVSLIEKADCESYRGLDAKRWVFTSHEQAGAFFFAALKGEEYDLALALIPFGPFTRDQALTHMVTEGFSGRDEYKLVELFVYDLRLKELTLSWALDNGRARFVGNVAKDIVWERRAFDKLIEEGHFDFAAELAEYGTAESFRKQGIGLAFVAAIKAKDLDMVRYFIYRYVALPLTEEMYKEEWKKAHGTTAPELYPKRKRIHRKPCVESDDWSVERKCR